VISGESSDPEAVYKKYSAYIAQMQKDGIDPAAFERCKRVLYANCVSSFDDSSEICHNMMDTILDGEDPFEEPQIIASITVEDANRVLRELFNEEKTAMAVVLPRKTKNKEE
jgi:predicted Zn-dependent peptidase